MILMTLARAQNFSINIHTRAQSLTPCSNTITTSITAASPLVSPTLGRGADKQYKIAFVGPCGSLTSFHNQHSVAANAYSLLVMYAECKQ